MRILSIGIFLALLSTSYSLLAIQDTLVPYRKGSLFGLSDLKGNIKLKPEYDLVEPLGNNYFKFSNFRIVYDTTKSYSGKITLKERIVAESGVLKDKVVLIPSSRHGNFVLVENALLVGSKEVKLTSNRFRKINNYSGDDGHFYNLKGKKLLSDDVKSFVVLDHVLDADGNAIKQSHLTIYASHTDGTTSILVFDVANQKMIEPILNRVKNFEYDEDNSSETCIMGGYYDSLYQYHKVRIRFDHVKKRHFNTLCESRNMCLCGDKNSLVRTRQMLEDFLGEIDSKNGNDNKGNFNNQGSSGLGGGFQAGIGPGEGNPQQQIKKKKGFHIVDDKTATFDELTLKLKDGEMFQFEVKNSSQSRPLIYTNGNKYGVIYSAEKRSGLIYDTLRYANSYSKSWFLAGKRSGPSNELKMGFIDNLGNEAIPMIYSNIEYKVDELKDIFLYQSDTTKHPWIILNQQTELYRFSFSEEKSKSTNNSLHLKYYFLKVTQNGKKGLIDLENKTILATDYDDFWKNELTYDYENSIFFDSYFIQSTVDSDFYVYKKDGKYGLFQITSKREAVFETDAIFPMKPICRYKDYAGIKGFDLVLLADKDYTGFCFAGSDGTKYFEK